MTRKRKTQPDIRAAILEEIGRRLAADLAYSTLYQVIAELQRRREKAGKSAVARQAVYRMFARAPVSGRKTPAWAAGCRVSVLEEMLDILDLHVARR